MIIGNMVTAAINKRPTPLLVDLDVKIRQRDLIETLYDFGVTCSYDEYLRFIASAASSAATDKGLRGISDHSSGLIQVIADNFDTDISSQNRLQSTHSLAVLTTQKNKSTPDDSDPVQTIRRLREEEMKTEVEADVPIVHFQGPKKPAMPQMNAKRVVPPLRVLAQQRILVQRANQLDFKFLECVINDPKVPECFNTKMSREENHSLKPGTSVAYTPLIDMVPSDPTTIMTAMFEARQITKQTGQPITVCTAYQQLYRVAVNVVWMYPEFSDDFVLGLGGMHTLMSFVGSVGTLMGNSGLEEVLKAAFGGVTRMLTGKNFPQNTRALRMVVEELLRPIIAKAETHDDLMSTLEKEAPKSRTAKLWLDNLIKPVLIMMMYLRAEREAEWSLYLWAVEQMIPYFFAAGHVNYARYGLLSALNASTS